jgi:hypothetical protein
MVFGGDAAEAGEVTEFLPNWLKTIIGGLPRISRPARAFTEQTTDIGSTSPSLLFLLRLSSVPLLSTQLDRDQILSAYRVASDLYGTASRNSFLHVQTAESHGDPQGTWVGVEPRRARSTDNKEVAETLSPRENGSVGQYQVGKPLDK